MITSILAGLTILIIGDSHLTAPGYLITTLHDGLTKQGAIVHTIGVCGSNPGSWLQATPGDCGEGERKGDAQPTFKASGAQTRPIANLITQNKPDLVVVVMGDTMAGYDKSNFMKTWAWQNTTQLTKAISSSGTACVWIGPAWGTEGGKYQKSFARVKQVSGFLATNVKPCSYIDSLKFSKPGEWATVDGQHFTASGYQQWGKALTQAISTDPVVQKLKR
ncbi:MULTISPECIES: SGNH/GDSL hydrolase family protein [unclassified Pusillimonas]|uniref:SGNH/GDSL hydrolase family protein n=1 Tax=unclassified Pusillimonas TaxID=2640016 RepID=UPI000B946504|nr:MULTISPECIES: SGNH/GDSL hydrolase family protein [unclassified Pusillimonas]OXR50705.1 cell division protein FtsQ [Pusillimonas sp. T2]ROT44750.1 SGNH/GDSL hydrolase family protein [Pusillimonas sp. NJUB218]